MEISNEDRETLERLERELWREKTRFDTQRMNELIAQDFFETARCILSTFTNALSVLIFSSCY